MQKSATVYTNDKKNPQLKLSIIGNVEKFVTIRPSKVRLRGVAGEKIKRTVTIIPAAKYPFKRMQKGSYFDIITLETDSKIRPELYIRVYGELRQQTEKEKKGEK
jgi:hypothetical protein